MKKIFMALVAALMLCGCSAYANAGWGGRRDVVLQYEDIGQDAAYRQFDKASWHNQREILLSLVNDAKEAYLNCKTIEDIYEVKDKIAIIKYYNSKAKSKAKSISVTNELKVLDRKITQTEAEYKKAKVITKPVNIDFEYDLSDE